MSHRRKSNTGDGPEGKAAAPRLITYPPEVESHRAAYEEVAEGLITLDRVRRDSPLMLADVDPPGWVGEEPPGYILFDAMQDHLRALFENLLVIYDDRFMRTLYVELRLFYDDAMRGRNSGMYGYRGKGGAR